MCNLYSQLKNQDAIRRLFKADHDRTGNMPPLPGIFPDYLAPIVRNLGAGRELMTGPPQFGRACETLAVKKPPAAWDRGLFHAGRTTRS